MAELGVGDPAPPFDLSDQHEERVRLADFAGSPLVVYFYPKAGTSGCTAQSCSVRDARAGWGDLGAAVVGVSPDAPAAQRRFDEKHDLGFPLLADVDHATAEAWGVWGEKAMYGRRFMGVIRSAFVVGADGRIAAAFRKVSPKDTVAKVEAALRAL